MSDTTTAAEADTSTGGGDQQQEQQQQERTFTQADVDKIVRDRLTQQAKTKFGDYDTLKAKAAGAQTVEEQLADLQRKHSEAETRAMRSEIASRHGISPEDRDLFLTGSDEATLTAQAERLAAQFADKKQKQSNVARNEGGASTTGGSKEQEERRFARNLFGGSD